MSPNRLNRVSKIVRDLVLLLFMVILISLAARSALSAYLLWGWAGLIAIQTFAYGFMQDIPYVQVFALLTLLLFLVKKDPEAVGFSPESTTIWFFVFGVHATLAAAFAYPEVYRNWELCGNLLKTLIYCLVMPMLVTNRYRIHVFIIALALSAGFHGILDGLKFIISAGGHISRGNSKLGDNNHLAVLVAMVVPVLGYLYTYSARQVTRYLCLSALVVNIIAVVSTRSRAGLLTLFALALWHLLLSRHKVRGFVVIFAVVIGVFAVAPAEWTERMETIKSANEDSSFMTRVMAWKRGSAIALENPVFGGGFHSVQAPALFSQFKHKQGILGFIETGEATYPAAAHSIYFEVLGDMGFLGLFLFLIVVMLPFFHRRRILQLTRSRPDLIWAHDLANVLAACMIAYLVGGASISAAYFELPYILIMLMAVLRIHITKECAIEAQPIGKMKMHRTPLPSH